MSAAQWGFAIAGAAVAGVVLWTVIEVIIDTIRKGGQQ